MKSLDEIEARADKATKGPWRLWHDQFDPDNKRGAAIESAWSHDEEGLDTELITDWCHTDDAEFIAHAREDVPRLVAALRAVEATMDRLDVARAEGTIQTYGQIQYAVRNAIRDALGS